MVEQSILDLLKISSNVACTSNGVLSIFKLSRKFWYCWLYFALNHSGNTKLKNGRRSSNFPCSVFRTVANLYVGGNDVSSVSSKKKRSVNKPIAMIGHENQNCGIQNTTRLQIGQPTLYIVISHTNQVNRIVRQFTMKTEYKTRFDRVRLHELKNERRS